MQIAWSLMSRGSDDRGRGSAAGVALATMVGVASWTALEYGIHRVLGHEFRGRGLASREHLAHHADVTYFTPARLKALSATVTTATAFPVAAAAVGRRRASGFTVGLVSMYFAYEVMHRRTHTHPPRGRYGRWARRNHLYHHARNPMGNFGVTTPLWDTVFGTRADLPIALRLGRRIAPEWMLDENGEVRPPYSGDYEVVGPLRATPALVQADREAAFANLPPALAVES